MHLPSTRSARRVAAFAGRVLAAVLFVLAGTAGESAWHPAASGAVAVAQSSARASSFQVEAKVRDATVGRREEVVYVLRITGATLSDLDARPQPPRAPGLALENRRARIEQDVVYQNGQLRRTLALAWTYRPERTGTTRFAPVTFGLDGRTFRTEEVAVRVLAQARTGTTGDASADPSEDLFIEATLSDTTIYRGEQATVAYRLFYRDGLRLRQSRLAGSWDAPGFWREELDVPARPDIGTSQRGGDIYRTILLKRVALFPTRTGTLTLSPLEIETRARSSRRSRGFLGRFLSSGRSREVEVASDSIRLHVQPLPGGAPPSFRGAVGTFRIDADGDGTHSANVGEAVEMDLTVSGYGNLATLEAPRLEVPPDAALDVYPPEARLDLDREGGRLRGSKTFTYTLIPQESGTFEVPPVAFSYFAPDAGRYQTLRTRPLTIRATGSAADLASPGTSSPDALPPGDLAGPLAETPAWTAPGRSPLYRQVWPYAALGLPAVLAAGLLAWRRRRARAEARLPEAHPTARRRLRQARRHLKRNRPRLFYEETERALRAFVGQRLDVSATGQTRAQFRRAFARAGVETALQDRFFGLLDECERARFAPATPDDDALQTASDRAHRLVADLADVLPSSPISGTPETDASPTARA